MYVSALKLSTAHRRGGTAVFKAYVKYPLFAAVGSFKYNVYKQLRRFVAHLIAGNIYRCKIDGGKYFSERAVKAGN